MVVCERYLFGLAVALTDLRLLRGRDPQVQIYGVLTLLKVCCHKHGFLFSNVVVRCHQQWDSSRNTTSPVSSERSSNIRNVQNSSSNRTNVQNMGIESSRRLRGSLCLSLDFFGRRSNVATWSQVLPAHSISWLL